jgi:hypothetical protein
MRLRVAKQANTVRMTREAKALKERIVTRWSPLRETDRASPSIEFPTVGIARTSGLSLNEKGSLTIA